MYEVEEVCDRVLFLSHGRILLEGDPRELPARHGKETLEDLFFRLTADGNNHTPRRTPPAAEVNRIETEEPSIED